jgi:ATP-binding cassette, subfamily F, member 3
VLEIDDLTVRMGARVLLEGASAFIAEGWKVGLIGRNGSGKSTLLRLIQEDVTRGGGAIRARRGAKLGTVEQEAPQIDTPLLAYVLAADAELAALEAEAAHAEDPHRIAEIHTRLAEIDAYSAEARASEILAGLGFAQDELTRPCREFSGGWRMRASLAGVLFAEPDLLLLDEPTNYLDLEGAAWLENYLKRYPHTVIVVSHDREMLNRSVTHVLALVDQKLEVHAGGYDAYLRRRAERAALQSALKAKQDNERARMQAFIDRFRAKASKARQAQSRMKMLARMTDITVPVAERALPFHFEEPAQLASPLIVLEDCDLGYVAGKPVLNHVSLRLDHDDRIGIIGTNGQGKTTLVKSIAARLPLMNGKRVAASAIKVGYFSQDQLDELHAGESVLDHVRDLAPELPHAKHRALAARMGFGVDKIETKVEKLSGGEKVRLLLGLMAYAKPHLLILDEPTSHLDIDSREALAQALNEYEGAVLLITHDIYLAESCVDRLWLVHGGRADPYDGDLDDYRALVLSADRPGGAKRKPAAPPPRPPAPPRGASHFALQRRCEETEKAMAGAEAALAKIDAALLEPDLFARDPERGAGLSRARETAVRALHEAEEAWLAASEALETAKHDS